MTSKYKNRKKYEFGNSYKNSEPNNHFKRRKEAPNKCLVWARKIITNNIVKGISLTALLSLLITMVGEYISQQRYYDELLDKYLISMEVILVKDQFHSKYLDHTYPNFFQENPNNNEENTNTALKRQKAKAEYEQVKSLSLALTQNTLRSLSRIDGICLFPETYDINLKTFPFEINHNHPLNKLCIPGTLNNPERRQFLVSFLDQAGLGFKNIDEEQLTEQPSESFLEGIHLGSLRTTKGINLDKINLSRAILRGANLKDANLRGAILTAANLSGAFLNYANLSDAFLVKTNLRNADLTDAILYNSNLERANLIDAKLKNVNLDNQTNFKGALYECTKNNSKCFDSNEVENRLTKEAINVKPGLDLNNLPEPTCKVLDEVFKPSIEDPTSCASIKKNKSLCALYDTDLSGVDLTGAKLADADLGKTNFTGADLTGANLTGANLKNTNLKDANLANANLQGAKNAKYEAINQAKLCNTILPNGKISDCPKNDS